MTTWSSRMTGAALTLSGMATLLLTFGRPWQGHLFAFVTLLVVALIGMAHLFPGADLYRYLPGTGVSIPTIVARRLSAGNVRWGICRSPDLLGRDGATHGGLVAVAVDRVERARKLLSAEERPAGAERIKIGG